MPNDVAISSIVVALQGRPISTDTPATNNVLEWNGSQWEPTALPTSLPPDGYAGGDLGGSYPDPTVNSISGSSVVATAANKLNILKGQNVNVSLLKTSNYTVLATDFIVGIGTLSGSITITLPSSPATGDLYVVKDVNGTCQQFLRDNTGTLVVAGHTITITPASGNIDGLSQLIMQTPYQSITVVYTGSQWSVI